MARKMLQSRSERSVPVLQAKDLDDSLMERDDLVDEDPGRFVEARNGDYLMVPFQCDCCHFWNIHKVAPNLNNIQDGLQMLAIRRATLDSMWARERATVESNRREGLRFMSESRSMGVLHPYPSRGLFSICLLYTSPSPRDLSTSRMPSSA